MSMKLISSNKKVRKNKLETLTGEEEILIVEYYKKHTETGELGLAHMCHILVQNHNLEVLILSTERKILILKRICEKNINITIDLEALIDKVERGM